MNLTRCAMYGGKTKREGIIRLMVFVILTVAMSILIFGIFIPWMVSDQYPAFQAMELKQLNRGTVSRFQAEGVVYQESRCLPTRQCGISQIIVERSGDHRLFGVIVPSSTNLKKGDPVEWHTLEYPTNAGDSYEYINVLR